MIPRRAEYRSPRLKADLPARTNLKDVAERLGATGLCLTGSVARREEGDEGDIDFWLDGFNSDEDTASQRATQLVNEFRKLLEPYYVDVRGDKFPVRPLTSCSR
jgi:predicted nucleotidyltransferase